MEAVDFIRKFGWEEASKVVEYRDNHASRTHVFKFNKSCVDNAVIRGGAYLYTESYGDYSVSVDDLKHYVDALELMQNFGGLKRAKRILKKSYTQFNTRVSVVWNDKPFQCSVEQLEQAIQLVEEVYYEFN